MERRSRNTLIIIFITSALLMQLRLQASPQVVPQLLLLVHALLAIVSFFVSVCDSQ